MAISKFLDPKNDFCFKRVFGSERNKDILLSFLNDMLEFEPGAKITELTFLKTVQDPEIASKKQSILDVLCRDERGRSVIVEMQVAKTKGFEKRAQYYAAKAYVSQINQGEQYLNLKEIIFLAITDFVMFEDKTAYKSDHVVLDKNTYDHDLKDFSFTFLELPKFTKSIDQLTNNVERWSYFFKHAHHTAEKDLDRIIHDNSIIGRAFEELNQFSWSEIELNTYEQELKRERDAWAIEAYKIEVAEKKGLERGIEKGMKQGLEQGLEKGLEQGRLEGEQKLLQIALTLYSQGMLIQQISEITKLDRACIEKFIQAQ